MATLGTCGNCKPKKISLGAFHGISHKYVQEYLNEFCYRFNRRYWEPQTPNRFLLVIITEVLI